mmetsp:Transcript_113881/g.254189  ORF Transcript_113881/g.254189 Transcript_113881/m.254189 type:complete len:202 (+) Transcript_113881:819-1424(+)
MMGPTTSFRQTVSTSLIFSDCFLPSDQEAFIVRLASANRGRIYPALSSPSKDSAESWLRCLLSLPASALGTAASFAASFATSASATPACFATTARGCGTAGLGSPGFGEAALAGGPIGAAAFGASTTSDFDSSGCCTLDFGVAVDFAFGNIDAPGSMSGGAGVDSSRSSSGGSFTIGSLAKPFLPKSSLTSLEEIAPNKTP